MTSGQARRKVGGMERRMHRLYRELVEHMDALEFEETGHQVQEMFGGLDLAIKAASTYRSHLNPEEWT